MSELEERIEEERIKKEERLEMLEKCVGRITELLKSKENLEDLVSEIEYEIKCLE